MLLPQSRHHALQLQDNLRIADHVSTVRNITKFSVLLGCSQAGQQRRTGSSAKLPGSMQISVGHCSVDRNVVSILR